MYIKTSQRCLLMTLLTSFDYTPKKIAKPC